MDPVSETTDSTSAPAAPATGGGPRPEPIRFFGTTWLNHTGVYGLRRAGVAAGSLAAAAAGCLILRFAYQGLAVADVGGFVNILVVAMFAICGAIAFRQTWQGYARRPDPTTEAQLRSLKGIGFIGSLLAYFFRSLTEAPGEKLRRTEYETALKQYERRRGSRTGNPAARKKPSNRRRS
ncbi:hypothetical protein BGM19_21300 [Streptomyces agglomeratus]|uniref:hypothetical protein n=1 Tax=Streptomyces agglomeratus TaxID=285458 RepID=UPI00086E612A|nr:hypothetical protein [Streptomyces agglomeratus]OEJ60152.1 hypothetical protein BGM19_21300 [Streptomyces agglomeratus]